MRLALAEIRRAKLRFGLLTGAVALLVFLILFQQTLASTLLGFFTGAIENQSAEVLVFDEDARRNVEGSVISPGEMEAVAGVEGVRRAAPLGEGTFTVDAGGELRDAVLFGYSLGGPGAPTAVSEGRLPAADGEAVASSVDADDGFGIGDVVEVVPGRYRLRVVGLAEGSRFSVLPTLFVSYPTFEAASLTANPDAEAVLPSLIAVDAEPGVDAVGLAADITASVEGVEALDRATAVQSLPGVAAVNSSFGVVLLLAFVTVVLVTGFFFLILTVQKAQALTLLRAIGASGGYLVRNLAIQVTLVTIGGVGLAAVLLAIAAAASSRDFPIEAEPRLIVTTGLAVLVLALAASIGAIRRVSRIDPASATTRPAGGGLA
ncbi:MAG TPA: FtsX-like permease family protein [Actinomycetota bacterium]|nr:FtsX-like permease family protein [Actinomycetota bacterium]